MSNFESMAFQFNLANKTYHPVSLDELTIDPNKKDIIYWIHLDLRQQDVFDVVTKKLGTPEDVIRLCNKEEIMPTLVDTNQSVTLKFHCLHLMRVQKKVKVDFVNLMVHLTNCYCLTIAAAPIPALMDFMKSFERALKYAKTPCFMLFVIMDNVINDYSRALYEFELIIDDFDLKIRTTQRNIYNEVTHLKKHIIKIERNAAAIRDLLMRISGKKIEVIAEQCRLSLLGLFDHSKMVVSESEAIREILNGMLDQIDNTLMQKMNQTIKILTAFAAIFLPLSLIAGIYGMNFSFMPELQWRYGYIWALGLMIVCALLLFLFFKKMKWF